MCSSTKVEQTHKEDESRQEEGEERQSVVISADVFCNAAPAVSSSCMFIASSDEQMASSLHSVHSVQIHTQNVTIETTKFKSNANTQIKIQDKYKYSNINMNVVSQLTSCFKLQVQMWMSPQCLLCTYTQIFTHCNLQMYKYIQTHLW